MSEISMGIKLGKEALENPTVRSATEAVAGAAGKMLDEALPGAKAAASRVEEAGANFLSSFDQASYRFLPLRELMTQIRIADGAIVRDTGGPSKIVFDENGRVQHILHNVNSTPEQRADHLLTAGYANLFHEDVLANEAASKTIGQSAGFIPQPIERWASPEEAQQNAVDGARAYVQRDAVNANNYSQYLTERFGPHTEDQQAWGRYIATGGEVDHIMTPGTADLINSGLPVHKAADVGVLGSSPVDRRAAVMGGAEYLKGAAERQAPLNFDTSAYAGRIIPSVSRDSVDAAHKIVDSATALMRPQIGLGTIRAMDPLATDPAKLAVEQMLAAGSSVRSWENAGVVEQMVKMGEGTVQKLDLDSIREAANALARQSK